MFAYVTCYGSSRRELVQILKLNLKPNYSFLYGNAHVIGEDGRTRVIDFGIYNYTAISTT